MAGTIRMTPEELRTTADKVQENETQIMEIISQMATTVRAAADNWEGAAQVAFVGQFEELYNSISSNLPQVTDAITSMLKGSADALEGADEQIASSLG